MKLIWISMAAASVLLIAFVIGVAVFIGPSKAPEIWMEIAKACIQLVVVVGLGGVVGGVLKVVDEQRSQRRLRDDLRFNVFQEVATAYHRLKFVRRNLRAVGLRRPGPEQLRPEQVSALREGQTTIVEVELNLEQMNRELETRSIFDRSEEIRRHLARLLAYLSRIIDEWEHHGGQLWADQQSVSLNELPRLQAFLGRAEDDFRPNAADPMGWVEWIVRDELVIARPSTFSRFRNSRRQLPRPGVV
jgi:hypothetical protein